MIKKLFQFRNCILLCNCILVLGLISSCTKDEKEVNNLNQVNLKSDYVPPANAVYIDPSATVNGTGTQASPWNGSTLASNPWKANTPYLFKRGTNYTHSQAIIIQLPGITFGAYGTGANPIIQTTNDHNFNGYGTGTAYGDMGTLTIQDLELIAPNDASAANIFQIAFMYAKGNVNITNCKIHGGFQGIRFYSCAAINVKVTGCEVYDIWSDGLFIYQVNSFEAGNNHVYNVNLSHPSGYPDDGDCIHMDDIPTIWLHNNILDHSSQPGKFCILVGATTTTFVGNATIENNTLIRQRAGNDNTVLYDGYAHGSQVIFRYNTVQNALLGLQSRSYDMQIYYNVFSNLDVFMELSSPKDYVSHAKIWNNTIYNCGKIINGYGELVDFKNNIVHTATSTAFTCNSNVTADYNDYYNITTIGGLTKGTHDITANPLLNNPSGSDFTLVKGSPCIDAGTNVLNTTTDINGNIVPTGLSIDMGAYEYGSGTSGIVSGAPLTNKPPVVNITSPGNSQNFNAPAIITISASASDPDGTISKVEFYNGTVKLGTSATAPYSFSWNNVGSGTYMITAVATDNLNAQTTSSVATVFVNSVSTNGAIFYSDCGLSGTSVTLAPGSYTTAAMAAAGISDKSISSIKVNGYQVIAYTNDNFIGTALTLTSDNGCLFGTGFNDQISSIKVVNLSANQPPVVSLTTPSNGQNFTAPSTVTISASASDSDGAVSKVEFFNGSVKLGEKTSAPYTFTWSGVAVGSYNITAVATDNLNAKTTSGIKTIWVNN